MADDPIDPMATPPVDPTGDAAPAEGAEVKEGEETPAEGEEAKKEGEKTPAEGEEAGEEEKPVTQE